MVGAAPLIRLAPFAVDCGGGVAACAVCSPWAGAGGCAFGCAAAVAAGCGRAAGFGAGVAALAAGDDTGLVSSRSLPNQRPADARRPENIPPDWDDAGAGAGFDSAAAVM